MYAYKCLKCGRIHKLSSCPKCSSYSRQQVRINHQAIPYDGLDVEAIIGAIQTVVESASNNSESSSYSSYSDSSCGGSDGGGSCGGD